MITKTEVVIYVGSKPLMNKCWNISDILHKELQEINDHWQ